MGPWYVFLICPPSFVNAVIMLLCCAVASRVATPSHVLDRWCLVLRLRKPTVQSQQCVLPRVTRVQVTPVLMHLPFRLSPLAAQRIGEAKHPGPGGSDFDVTFMVTNPTAIHQKMQLLIDFGASVFMLSETSATASVQKLSGAAFRSRGFSTAWGQPAPRQQRTDQAEDGFRGAPAGVSAHSRFPLRISNLHNQGDWHHSGRFLHSFVQLGSQVVQLVVLYGIPSCHPRSKSDTNDLLLAAIDAVRHSSYPYVIAGDLNHPLDTLPAYQILKDVGSLSVAEWYQLKGQEIPPTFKSARNDVAILAPSLVPMLRQG